MEDQVSFKVYTYWNESDKPEVRRFGIEKNVVTNFHYLNTKLQEVFPDLKNKHFNVSWKDEEGDDVTVSSDHEVTIALVAMQSQNLIKLFIYCKDPKPHNDECEISPGTDKACPKVSKTHCGVVCDGCESPVVGFRYKCTTCDDFDLCSKCEGAGMHPDHCMVRVPMFNMPHSGIKAAIKRSNHLLKTIEEEHSKKRREQNAERKRLVRSFANAHRYHSGDGDNQQRTRVSWLETFGNYLNQFVNLDGEVKIDIEKVKKCQNSNAEADAENIDTSADPKNKETSADPKNKETSADPKNKDTPVDPKNKDTPTDPKKKDSSADLKKKETPADPKKKETPAYPKKKDTTADPKKKEIPADPKKKDTPADPKKKETPADPKKKDTPADPKKKETPADPKKKDTPADPKKKETTADLKEKKSKAHQPQNYVVDNVDVQMIQNMLSALGTDLKKRTYGTNTQSESRKPVNIKVEVGQGDKAMQNDKENMQSQSLSSSKESKKEPTPEIEKDKVDGWTVINKEKDLQDTNTKADLNDVRAIGFFLPKGFNLKDFDALVNISLSRKICPSLNVSKAVVNPKKAKKTTTSTQPQAAGNTQARNTATPSAPAADNGTRKHHPLAHIDVALEQMIGMGFTNEGGWLTKLLENKNGNVAAVLDLLTPVNSKK